MQLTKGMLTRIIKEELSHVLAEILSDQVQLALAVRDREWENLAKKAAGYAERSFPKGKSDDMSRRELFTYNWLTNFSREIKQGGEETMKKFAKLMKANFHDFDLAHWPGAFDGAGFDVFPG